MTATPPASRVCLVVGAGDATGGSICKRFAREGYVAVPVRRSADKLAGLVAAIAAEGGRAVPFGADGREEAEIEALFDRVEAEIGPVECCVFNVGGNAPAGILEQTSAGYRKVWEQAALAGFLTGRAAAKRMVTRGRGTILFTGATASLRGGARFAAFSGAKMALRALAQSMARELAPRGIHVAHVVVDGAIDTAFVREFLGSQYEARKAAGALLDPDAIAETYWHLHAQPRSAWTFEVDLRPFAEAW